MPRPMRLLPHRRGALGPAACFRLRRLADDGALGTPLSRVRPVIGTAGATVCNRNCYAVFRETPHGLIRRGIRKCASPRRSIYREGGQR